MSITNLQLITNALREINVIGETEDASAEQGSTCLQKLNGLMEIWREVGIDFGWYAQDDTAGTAPVPDWLEWTVWSNLAIACASQYGATVSTELATVADRLYTVVLNKAIREELDNVDMSHLPEGSGRYGNRYDLYTDR